MFDHLHDHVVPTAGMGWDNQWGLNGVQPGGGRCAACHLFTAEDYLLCKPCWDRLPPEPARDLTALWHELKRGAAGAMDTIRFRQAVALDSIKHVPPEFCPYCPIEGQAGADVFRSIRPDACVAAGQ